MQIQQAEISINDIKVYAYHGVLPQERLRGTYYLVSLHCQITNPNDTLSRILSTDNVEDTINYANLCDIVKKEMLKPSNLIETVATRIGQHILETYTTISQLKVTVKKLNPPVDADCDNAAVTLTFAQ